MSKRVYGVGVNDANYNVCITEIVNGKQKTVWRCPYYRVWIRMLERAYDDNYHKRNPTYKDVTVCDDWHLFTNFRSWMLNQNWEGNQLDKDLLFHGNKVYAPETCVFVDQITNAFTIDCGANRGEYMIGCYWHKRDGKFVARCNNPFTKKQEHLGYFTDELAAHKAWKERKHELAKQLAGTQTDERVANALRVRYEDFQYNQ